MRYGNHASVAKLDGDGYHSLADVGGLGGKAEPVVHGKRLWVLLLATTALAIGPVLLSVSPAAAKPSSPHASKSTHTHIFHTHTGHGRIRTVAAKKTPSSTTTSTTPSVATSATGDSASAPGSDSGSTSAASQSLAFTGSGPGLQWTFMIGAFLILTGLAMLALLATGLLPDATDRGRRRG